MIPEIDISDDSLVKAIEKRMVRAIVASCNCVTKTPDTAFHREDCRYRALAEGLGAIKAFREFKEHVDDQGREQAFYDRD